MLPKGPPTARVAMEARRRMHYDRMAAPVPSGEILAEARAYEDQPISMDGRAEHRRASAPPPSQRCSIADATPVRPVQPMVTSDGNPHHPPLLPLRRAPDEVPGTPTQTSVMVADLE
ncbi:hypothetical protein GGTG_06928 [Gaeumannomyces tritici R3-111a-1]|uniref:Uncharacterized protein n=1 Tax=Gaeumannomyces tritici (strain R3-111a-1) TaxID=644352 RepID=J3P081_GAET3|nr:hypothetical protein GGTG_06928 [Gaeumannomyces tritici R3-111a-1]EJT77014.1 hypothetical protein GGTG_06928 [Gaeumannomyces tritici R3-111a-1]